MRYVDSERDSEVWIISRKSYIDSGLSASRQSLMTANFPVLLSM